MCLVFSPHAAAGRDPLAALEAAAPFVDIVQVRPKSPESASALATGSALHRTSARELLEWTLKTLDVLRGARCEPLVIVNDRVDVARALAERGVDGVHVGQDDAPAHVARAVLGEDALIGLSTHSLAQVVAGQEAPVDYFGFGPIWATATKGYERGLGATAAWVAQHGCDRPVFPIGGVDVERAEELAECGRAAVSSAILAAADPADAARRLRAALESD